MSTEGDLPSSPSAPPVDLPYPTADSISQPSNPSTVAPPTLPYPTTDPVYPVDPAYPPAQPTTQNVIAGGTTTTAPSPAGQNDPMIPGSTVPTTEGIKGPELPPYSAPPPSYSETFPGTQPPPAQPLQTYPQAGYGTQAQYVAPAPQEMVRVHGAAAFNVECPKCHEQVLTTVRLQAGVLVYLVAFVCILFGGIFGCCLIPFCIPGLKDVYHICPNCKHVIGRYDRLS